MNKRQWTISISKYQQLKNPIILDYNLILEILTHVANDDDSTMYPYTSVSQQSQNYILLDQKEIGGNPVPQGLWLKSGDWKYNIGVSEQYKKVLEGKIGFTGGKNDDSKSHFDQWKKPRWQILSNN